MQNSKFLYLALILMGFNPSFAQLGNQFVEQLLKDSIRIQQEELRGQRLQEYISNNSNDSIASIAIGSPAKGKLVHGKLIDFKGPNYQYFDSISYMSGRAFVHEKVKLLIEHSYARMAVAYPDRTFYVMECSRKHGGPMFPHKTHQNGLSVDFMTPFLKAGRPYSDLDTLGANHYWIECDDQGRLTTDTQIKIDFNSVAQHLIYLQEEALKLGMSVEKVIFKLELKDELFSCEVGQDLKTKQLYFAKKLSPTINNLHDDHYHVDFRFN